MNFSHFHNRSLRILLCNHCYDHLQKSHVYIVDRKQYVCQGIELCNCAKPIQLVGVHVTVYNQYSIELALMCACMFLCSKLV